MIRGHQRIVQFSSKRANSRGGFNMNQDSIQIFILHQFPDKSTRYIEKSQIFSRLVMINKNVSPIDKFLRFTKSGKTSLIALIIYAVTFLGTDESDSNCGFRRIPRKTSLAFSPYHEKSRSFFKSKRLPLKVANLTLFL